MTVSTLPSALDLYQHPCHVRGQNQHTENDENTAKHNKDAAMSCQQNGMQRRNGSGSDMGNGHPKGKGRAGGQRGHLFFNFYFKFTNILPPSPSPSSEHIAHTLMSVCYVSALPLYYPFIETRPFGRIFCVFILPFLQAPTTYL